MDTSERYIEMCRAAVEIQKTWNPHTGDFYVSTSPFIRYTPQIISRVANFPMPASGEYSETWLPRQDQLQDMIDDNFVAIFDQFHKYLRELVYPDVANLTSGCTRCEICGSAEQHWLMFVMSEKHGKHWNDAEWELPYESSCAFITERIGEFRAENVIPKYMFMNEKTLDELLKELHGVTLPTNPRFAAHQSALNILGLEVVLKAMLSDGEIQIMGEPL